MVDIKYEKAYSEVLEILKYIPREDYNKIPKEKINLFERYASRDCKIIYNPSRTLDENKISRIAKGIIAILYRDYWTNPEDRETIIKWQKYQREKIEEQKKQIYNKDNLFKKKDIENNYQQQNEDLVENELLIEVKQNNIFVKIIEYVKKIFHIDN